MSAADTDGMGGFKDARTYRQEALSARSHGRALLAEAMADERIVCLGADLSQPTETWLFGGGYRAQGRGLAGRIG